MMSVSRLRSLIKVSTIFILIGVIENVFMVCVTLADIENKAHWPVEVTEWWNPVYGKVTGISLDEGDSVGMFDTEGNCYGAGLVRGGYYYLSAFQREEAKLDISGDFPISGFEDGDMVIFKAYKKSTGKEYTLTPSSGGAYYYTYRRYPPIRIDLVYGEGIPPTPPEEPEEPTTPSTPSSDETQGISVYPEGVFQEEEEKEEEKEVEPEKPPTLPEEIRKRDFPEEEISRRDEMREPFPMEPYEEYPSRDVEPSRVTPSRYDLEEKKDKETMVAELPSPKPKAIEIEKEVEEEKEPIKKRFPLFAKIILLGIILLLAILLAKRLRERNKDKEEL